MKLLFLTGNKNKLEEAKKVLPEIESLDLEIDEIQGIDPKIIIEAKLKTAVKLGYKDVIVEDTSLFLDKMNGLPGPLVKWFLKTVGNEGLWAMAQTFGQEAEAKVLIGYIDENEELFYFEGVIKGKIVAPRGTKGWGWDPIFLADGFDKTFAEMTNDEKTAIDMRRMALVKLKEHLEKKY